MRIPCWMWHSDKVIHRKDMDSGAWFEHRQCEKCKKHRIVRHNPFYTTITQSIDLGVNIGAYKGIVGTLKKIKFEEAT